MIRYPRPTKKFTQVANVLNMCNFQNEVRDRVVLLENVVNSNPTLMERLDTLERRMQEVTVRQSQTLLLPT